MVIIDPFLVFSLAGATISKAHAPLSLSSHLCIPQNSSRPHGPLTDETAGSPASALVAAGDTSVNRARTDQPQSETADCCVFIDLPCLTVEEPSRRFQR
ncbi:hypothetical protein [Cutibacterium acnes]|uniref:hypothetical protein n=1 Tax=Cutibacterium acnes TaxID=1747 RepID=UPI0001EF3C30|nr:hypothetical protein [Cutibacterium acnes]EFS76806.1 hypothetical protein HMPREF9591_01419 [Cutibacterium acnes HL086PA1]